MAAAKRAARISRSVNTAWGQGEEVREHRRRWGHGEIPFLALRKERQVDLYE